MPRISKRNKPDVNVTKGKINSKSYNVGIYARLSADINDKKNESIVTQLDIAKKHIEHLESAGQQLELIDIYSDLGKTGTNFDRSEFNKMMQDIRMGVINCVIVKDLSRFGRNYLEAGNYIEKIFPFLGVRFIAVTDGIDTAKEDNEDKKITMNIKNLVNDMYAMDASIKAKTHIKQRREREVFIGGHTPYGYTDVLIGKDRKLAVHPETSEVIRLMFDLFIKEKNFSAVAKELTANRINTPECYWKTKEVLCEDGQEQKAWHSAVVRSYLVNETYIGTLIQCRTSWDNGVTVHNDSSKWIRRENSHEAIVDIDIFNEVQAIIAEKSSKRNDFNKLSGKIKQTKNIYEDVFYCGKCGRKIHRSVNLRENAAGIVNQNDGYFCPNSRANGLAEKCESNNISGTRLNEIFLAALKIESALYMKKPQKYLALNEELGSEKKKEVKELISKASHKLERLEAEESALYIKYREKEINIKEYTELKKQCKSDIEALNNEIDDMKQYFSSLDNLVSRRNKAIMNLMKLKNSSVLDKELIDLLVDKIYLYPGKRIEIVYSFGLEMEGVV